MIAVGIANIPHYTRVVRASVLSIKSSVYIEAARVIGCGDPAIMFRHILPNALASVIVMATLGVAGAILTGGRVVLPRPRRPAADPRVGRYAQRRPRPAPQ